MADDAIESLWERAKKLLRSYLKREPTPETLTQDIIDLALANNPEVLAGLAEFYEGSSALRRAGQQRALLDKARIMWVDDHPENNSWERRTLESFGVTFVTAEKTSSALALARRERFNAVISDIGRDVGASGIEALPAIRTAAPGVPVVLYVGALEPGTPPGAFGITNDPEELIHLLLDALARTRL